MENKPSFFYWINEVVSTCGQHNTKYLNAFYICEEASDAKSATKSGSGTAIGIEIGTGIESGMKYGTITG